jgi:hypothetical protein
VRVLRVQVSAALWRLCKEARPALGKPVARREQTTWMECGGWCCTVLSTSTIRCRWNSVYWAEFPQVPAQARCPPVARKAAIVGPGLNELTGKGGEAAKSEASPPGAPSPFSGKCIP